MGKTKLNNLEHGDCKEFSVFDLKAMGTMSSPSYHQKAVVRSETLRCVSRWVFNQHILYPTRHLKASMELDCAL